MAKALCIIPARAGSKRIKGKNKKLFLGIPIINYIIEVCMQSKLFYKIIVASDDEKILELAREYPIVEGYARSKDNADDLVPLAGIVEEVLSVFRDRLPKDCHYSCCALPTAVFSTSDDLVNGLEKLKKSSADSVATFLKYRYPVQRASKLSKDLRVKMLDQEHRWTRTQDLEPVYHDAGQFYWFRTAQGLRGNKKYGVILKNQFAVDIDDPEDWDLAERLFKLSKE